MCNLIKIFVVLSMILVPCLGIFFHNTCQCLCDDTASVRTRWPIKVIDFRSAALTASLKSNILLDVFKFARHNFEICPNRPRNPRILQIFLCKQFNLFPPLQQIRTGCNNFNLGSLNIGIFDFLTSHDSHLLYMGECRPPGANSGSSESRNRSRNDRNRSRNDRNRSRNDRNRSRDDRNRSRNDRNRSRDDRNRSRNDRNRSRDRRRSNESRRRDRNSSNNSRRRNSNESRSRRNSNEWIKDIKLSYQ